MLGGQSLAATPNNGGQSGYINVPSAVVEADGTFSAGYSYDSPYGQLWVSSTILPFLQVTGRYVSIGGIPAFPGQADSYGAGYGRYKDKVLDAKLRLWQEDGSLPAVAIGQTDLFGTELFGSRYIVATKTFGVDKNIETSLGYGTNRTNGLFAGARWTPLELPRWSLVAEYNSLDYTKDYLASETGAARRHKGPAMALEYRWGWLGMQVARNRDQFSANAFVTIPFGEKEYIPKVFEPPYFQDKDPVPPPSIPEWHRD